MKRVAQFGFLLFVLSVGAGLFAQTPYFHWYQLNEGTGAVIANTATQSGVGTIAAQGVFTDGTGVATPTWTSPGGLGNTGVDLSTPTAFLDSGLDPDLHLNTIDFTVEMLINTNGTAQTGNILFAVCDASTIEAALYVTGMGTSQLALAGTGGGFVDSGGPNLNDGNWHHVALVYDRSAQTATGYVDGTQAFQATSQSWTFSAGTKVVYFNGRTLSSFGRWSALADEIKLDNTARSPSAFVMPSPGGGGGDGGGDDESCSTAVGQSELWVFGVLFLLFVAVRTSRRREA
ncbi:MAG: LamG domain-containing protein [Planctomycetes bacterium]|nr:LamG domain-containing protein [Planctomycetota bacterium]MCA8935465.1 LamG domain-containing protein [Planctomycetota bacterium]